MSPRAEAGLLSQLKSAMQSEPATWAQRYDMQRFSALCCCSGSYFLAKSSPTRRSRIGGRLLDEAPEDPPRRSIPRTKRPGSFWPTCRG